MRVVFEEQVRAWARAQAARGAPVAVSCLVDLSLGCNLRCRDCHPGAGQAPPRAAARALLQGVARRAGESGASQLDLAFFGGEPLLAAGLVLELSARLRRECGGERIGYAGHLITNGTLLGVIEPRSLARAGLQRIQVTLDGGPRTHDERRRMQGGGGSWRAIVEGLKRLRGAAEVVVRSGATRPTSDLEELLGALDDEGLAGSDGIAALLLARPASYAQQARDLLRVFPLLHDEAGEQRPLLN